MLCLVAGCGESVAPDAPVKKLDEPLTVAEVQTFLAIAEGLPEKKLPATLRCPFPPLPAWASTRSRPIAELMKEEQTAEEEGWAPARLVPGFTGRRLNELLIEHQLTPEQFAGLTLAVTVSLARESLPEQTDLPALNEQGQKILVRLRADHRPFSRLSADDAFDLLQMAAWIPMLDIVRRLSAVPKENIEVVRKERDRIRAVLPPDFIVNPLAACHFLLEDDGIPFQEMPGSGRDDEIVINRQLMIVGHDAVPLPVNPLPPPAAPPVLPSAPESHPVEPEPAVEAEHGGEHHPTPPAEPEHAEPDHDAEHPPSAPAPLPAEEQSAPAEAHAPEAPHGEEHPEEGHGGETPPAPHEETGD